MNRRILSCLLCLTAVSLFASSPLPAMPLHPDLIEKLRREGRLESLVGQIAADRERGIDNLGYAGPVLRPGEGAAPGDPRSKGAFTATRQAIVILVDFSDNVADTGTYPSSHYDDMLFSVGSYATGSMADYYLENSYGNFLVTGTATQWYRMPHTYDYYVDGQRGFGTYPHNAQKLTEDAVAAADADVDFSQFDNDGPDGIPNSGDDDGVVDALFVVHAGRGYEQTGDPDMIHSHAWTTVDVPVVDGVRATRYSMEPDDGKVGVFSHEFGHVLGLPDLYDTDYDSRGVGYWSIMAGGSWGNGGITPVHFDGWSKLQLGFATPVQPTNNVTAASFPNVEDNATVYKIWTNGMPEQQYFVAENRQQTGFDAYLPGEGIVIYHVDDAVPGNTDQTHYKVAVEQADGDFDLENYTNGGDSGDPWPGSTNNTAFDAGSTPDSRDYDGDDTEVGVLAISSSSTNMTADIQVETGPALHLAADSVADGSGGTIEPGETGVASFQVLNAGLAATAAYMTLSTVDPNVALSVDSIYYGDIPADNLSWGGGSFQFDVSGACPGAHGIPFTLEKRAAGGYAASEDLVIGVSDTLGFFRWGHDAATAGYGDQWHLSKNENHSTGGFVSWYCGGDDAGVYGNYSDGALYTEPFLLTGTSELSFWHMLDAEEGTPPEAWDGAVVEISTDGGPWSSVEPDGGYTHTIIDNPASPFPPDMPCFSGTFSWRQETFDLSSYSGLARIRFRFGSDGGVTQGGWYVDDVSLLNVIATSAPETEEVVPLGLPRLSQNAPNPFGPATTVRFTLPERTRVSLKVYDIRGRLVRDLVDGEYPAGRWGASWNGRDDRGREAPSGVYLYRFEAGSRTATKKMILTR